MRLEESKRDDPGFYRKPSDFLSPFDRQLSLTRMPSALQELQCYSAQAPTIRDTAQTPTQREVNLFLIKNYIFRLGY